MKEQLWKIENDSSQLGAGMWIATRTLSAANCKAARGQNRKR